jgi:hypothetical protein
VRRGYPWGDCPDRLVAPEERLEPNLIVPASAFSASQIRQTVYFTNNFRFSFRKIEVTSVRRHDAHPDLAYGKVYLAIGVARECQSLAGASPVCPSVAREAPEDRRKQCDWVRESTISATSEGSFSRLAYRRVSLESGGLRCRSHHRSDRGPL